MTQDYENRLRWILAELDALKHQAPSQDVRRHLGRAKSSVALALERVVDEGNEAA